MKMKNYLLLLCIRSDQDKKWLIITPMTDNYLALSFVRVYTWWSRFCKQSRYTIDRNRFQSFCQNNMFWHIVRKIIPVGQILILIDDFPPSRRQMIILRGGNADRVIISIVHTIYSHYGIEYLAFFHSFWRDWINWKIAKKTIFVNYAYTCVIKHIFIFI